MLVTTIPSHSHLCSHPSPQPPFPHSNPCSPYPSSSYFPHFLPFPLLTLFPSPTVLPLPSSHSPLLHSPHSPPSPNLPLSSLKASPTVPPPPLPSTTLLRANLPSELALQPGDGYHHDADQCDLELSHPASPLHLPLLRVDGHQWLLQLEVRQPLHRLHPLVSARKWRSLYMFCVPWQRSAASIWHQNSFSSRLLCY